MVLILKDDEDYLLRLIVTRASTGSALLRQNIVIRKKPRREVNS
jgi:hypothetical protein